MLMVAPYTTELMMSESRWSIKKNNISNYTDTNDLHMPLQSAYKQNHSTESPLLKVKNDILLNMEAQKLC